MSSTNTDTESKNYMNILVTGGAGYIGSHATRKLIEVGHIVTVLDNLSCGHRAAVPDSVPFCQVDLKETQRIEEILRKHQTQAVMHFAALISVGESVQKPLLYYQNNTAGAMSLLIDMDNVGVKRFIVSSTTAKSILFRATVVKVIRQGFMRIRLKRKANSAGNRSIPIWKK